MTRLEEDERIVLTLDAGRTKIDFNAVQGGRQLLPPLRLATEPDDLDKCLRQLQRGFEQVHEATGRKAVAISFAFPGPCDYPQGVVGDLGNFPAFRGGVALGPLLEDRFGVPVLLNNDGDLFAYGEALGGLLPFVNDQMRRAGSARRFRNLLGFTLGTGFGGGVVCDGRLVRGDNSAAGEVWLLRHRDERRLFAEEGISIRAVRREYQRLTGMSDAPEPREIAAIAAGEAPGDPRAAKAAFERLGRVAGDAIAEALCVVDGLVVIGGGLSAAAPLFLPALVEELNGSLESLEGARFDRLELKAFDLEDPAQLETFLRGKATQVRVPGSSRTVAWDPQKRTGVGISRLGTSAAVALGAYAVALDHLRSLP